jgi:dCMP deaminase
MNRPSWDEYFIGVTKLISQRSTCLRRAVGCVLVLDNRILSSGYNGSPSGLEHCSVAGCIREKLKIPSGEKHELCRGLHGEMNSLIQCALHGISTEGATLYSTTLPCSICTKMLIQAGIKRIVYVEDYNDALSKQFLDESIIEVVKYEGTKKLNKKIR